MFSDAEVQTLLAEKFIPVAADDWYQRRRQDAEGEFFRGVAAQGPRREAGGTRQGHYVLTAGGKLLGYNNNRGPEKRLAMMREALEKWESLAEGEKKVTIGEAGEDDARYAPALPEGGAIIRVSTRALEREGERLRAAEATDATFLTAVDHLWLRAGEVRELRGLAETGGELSEALALRIARFHLLDNTRGEPRNWSRDEVKSVKVTVLKGGELKGGFEVASPDRSLGYEGVFSGRLAFGEGREFEGFDLLVVGDHWGESRYTRGARPGRSPLGQVFQLVREPAAADRIPPQGIRAGAGYWESDRF